MASTDETADYVAIRRLQDRYADVVTRNAWNELGELFLPDATIEVDVRSGDPMRFTGPTELGEFIASAITQFGFFQFVILNAVIDLVPAHSYAAASGRMYMSELRTDRDTGTWITSYGLYRDRYVRHDGRWWFDQRRYCSLARTDAAGTTEWFTIPQED
jgi:hypothetical protein